MVVIVRVLVVVVLVVLMVVTFFGKDRWRHGY